MSDTKCCVFSNPDNLPVEQLTLLVNNAGVVQQISALDAYWVEKRQLTIYERPPAANSLVLGALDVWRNRMEVYLDDVRWLLALEHHRFWSTVLHHPESMDMLVSFLQEASPPYLPPHECRNVQQLYEQIRSKVLVVFSRLITNKESRSQWMTKEYMREVIYDKFIFTVPILWDICLVYGADNTQHVAKLLAAVFTLQPKYLADLDAAIAFVKEAFKYIILQVNKDYDNADPPNLPETFKGFSEIRRPSPHSNKDERLTLALLRDLVVHLLDTSLTLRLFVEAYPSCVEILKRRGFVLSIVQVYEHAVPHLYEKLDELDDGTSVPCVQVREYIDAARAELIDVFREVLAVTKDAIFSGDIVQVYEHAVPHLYEKLDELDDGTSVPCVQVREYIDAARAELIDVFREVLAVTKDAIFSGEGSIESHVEAYLAVMMDGLSERLLIQDYHACYPVHEDLEMLKQAYPNIDPVKTDFILQAIYSNLDEPIPDHILNPPEQTNGHSDTFDNEEHNPGPSKETDIPDHIKEESLITEVKDIFPDLGDGFILKCLQHYGFNSERVINSILEDNLADSLRSLDRSLPIIPEDILDKKFLETGIERLNVFDGDQFDIMTRDDVDVSKIHLGKKKGKYRNIKDMLDDKSDVKQRTDIYSKYNMVCDEEDMYSDEYDDTYDDEAPTPKGDSTVDDLGRPLVTPRALAKPLRYEEESDSEPEPAEQTPSSSNRNRMDFCQNPEEIRARREAAMRVRQGKGHRAPPPQQPQRSQDVTGKPKGQGQEKDVLHNRDKKEKHKSARANHNRRQGAQWKRSQGMMPS